MPDITMCMDMTCSQKETCYRYKAKPNEYRQSYFMNSPRPEDGGECTHYWKIEDEDKRHQQVYRKRNMDERR